MAIIYSYPLKNIPELDDTFIISDSGDSLFTKQLRVESLKTFIDTNYNLTLSSSGPNKDQVSINLANNKDITLSSVLVQPGNNITYTLDPNNTGFKINGQADKTEIFTQVVEATQWSITHSLNKFPSVTVVDTAGTIVYGRIAYINSSVLTINFSIGFRGKAFLN